MNTRVQKIARLRNKEYRDAFVASQINVGLPFQIRSLREQREWKQSQLAEKAGMLQPRISAIETPGGTKFTLETLRRLASAFDVALLVKFAPFSELVDRSEDFNPDMFSVPSFGDDPGLLEKKGPEAAIASTNLLAAVLDATELGHYQEDTPTANNVIMFPSGPQQDRSVIHYASYVDRSRSHA